MFHNLSDIIDHKKHYCKLRFTCKCAPKISGSENDGRDSGMIIRGFNQIEPSILPRAAGTGGAAPQRAKIAEKVHKPPLCVNVINFELNGFNAFIWVPWSPSDTKKL